MKGIVLEIEEGNAAVLTDDGMIRGIKDRNYRIGEEIAVKEVSALHFSLARWGAGIAAAFVLFAAGAFAYITPAAYISMDVNPSVEISINMFDRVLDVKAVNDDGEELVSTIRLKHMSIQKAMEQLTATLIQENYISDDENGGVIITTSGENLMKAEKLAAKLETKVQQFIDKEGKTALVEAEAVGLERVKEAQELGVTPGKLNLVQKLANSVPDPETIIMEEWLDKPVKEINKRIKENRKALKNQDKAEQYRDIPGDPDDDGNKNPDDGSNRDSDDEDEDLNHGRKAGHGDKPDWKNPNKGKQQNRTKENGKPVNIENETWDNIEKYKQKGNKNKIYMESGDDDDDPDR